MSPDYLCKWQVQVLIYFAMRIPAHLRCTQCVVSDLDLSQHHPFFFRSSTSHPAGTHGRIANPTPQKVNWEPVAGAGCTQFAQLFLTAMTTPPLVGCVVCRR